jgi:hypothetical protein
VCGIITVDYFRINPEFFRSPFNSASIAFQLGSGLCAINIRLVERQPRSTAFQGEEMPWNGSIWSIKTVA